MKYKTEEEALEVVKQHQEALSYIRNKNLKKKTKRRNKMKYKTEEKALKDYLYCIEDGELFICT